MLILSDLFTDGAVLQRRKPISVWGWAQGSARLKASLNGKSVYTAASMHGEFIVRFPAMEAGGPYELTVENSETGEKVCVKDVLIGEVWLCSGQSNMEYCLNSDWAPNGNQKVARSQEAEFKKIVGKQTTLRFFTVAMGSSGANETTLAHENSRNQDAARWIYLDEDEAGKCTAIGAWFGLKVWQQLGIPVGLVNSSYGGTIVEAWTSRQGLLSNPDTVVCADKAETAYQNEQVWEKDMMPVPGSNLKWKELCEEDRPDDKKLGMQEGWASLEYSDADWETLEVPGSWVKEKFAKNGAVWYRKTVEIPKEWEGHDITLHTGGIDKHDIAFFNGKEIGRTGEGFEELYWAQPRRYKIPADCVKAGKAVVAIRVFSFVYDGGMNGAAEAFFLEHEESEKQIPLCGTWKAKCEFESNNNTENIPVWVAPSFLGRSNPNTPHILFDTMIRPLLPMTMRGVIWYQGCSNAGSIQETAGYGKKMVTLLEDWRRQFEQMDLVLIQVQLAGFRAPYPYGSNFAWPYLRDEQRIACEKIPGMYMITALDTGEANDIHPQNKKTPGTRLADCALANVYQVQGIVPNGPLYRRYAVEGNGIRLYFDCAEGLHFKGNPEDSFAIGGEDGTFVMADGVTIENGTVFVRSSKISVPLAVRYAWSDNPTNTLYNGTDIPAASFSTEN